jgi:hypothetical protein
VRRWVLLRSVTVAAAALVLVGLSAGPASAHTISGPKPTNYRSHIVGFSQPVPGISAQVVDLGNKFQLTNRTSTEITVLGYEGEPYLRIGPNGVFENLHSQSTYINKTRLGGTVPVGVDTSPTAVPEWKKISSAHSARWHDHRIHWMSTQPPPPVAQSPGRFYHLSKQNVVVLFGPQQQPVRIAVALDWVPGPSGLPWLPAIVVLFALGVVAALMPRWWRLLGALVGLIVISDLAHAIGFEIPRPGSDPAKFFQFLGGSFVSIAVWIAAVPTIITLLRRRIEALYGVVFVGLLIALIGGATDLSALWKSQIPDAGPPWLTRVEVVIALGVGGGLVVGALIRMLRSRALSTEHESGGRWLSLLVSGLSDAELARIVPELDADEVLGVALRELAFRAGPVADAFESGSLVFVVTDQPGPPTWSVGGSSSTGLGASSGTLTPEAARIQAPFAAMLQLLAGARTIDDAASDALIQITGDTAFVARLAPFIPETSGVTGAAEDPASAS